MRLRIAKYGDVKVIQCWEPDIDMQEQSGGFTTEAFKRKLANPVYLSTGKWVDVPVINMIPDEGNL